MTGARPTKAVDVHVSLRWPARDEGEAGPSPRQIEFIECKAFEQLYGGSKRGGKTVAGAAKAIMLSVLFPGNRGMICRQAFTDLRDSSLVTLFALMPPELLISHNRTEHKIVLRTKDKRYPSEIIYRGLGEESEVTSKAKEKVKSIELGWLWVDEPSEVSFEAYRMLIAQLCWRLPNGKRPPYMALLTSNPEPGWVKDRFIDKDHPGYIIGKADAEFIPSLPRDNPGLPKNWESDLRLTMDPAWITRYLDGSWDIHEGMCFPELHSGTHDLDAFTSTWPAETHKKWLRDLKLISGMDHATTGITACVQTGFDPDDNVYALREYYEPNRRIDEHAPQIAMMLNGFGKQEYTLIDPSTESKTQQGAHELFSYLDEWIRHLKPFGIHPIPAKRSAIEIGVDVIRQFLHPAPVHRHPFTGQLGAPRLYISRSGCPNLWREMANMKRVPKPDGSLMLVGSDHAVDSLRYVVMSRPDPPVRVNHDIEAMTPQERFLIQSHVKWGKQFDKQIGGGNNWWVR